MIAALLRLPPFYFLTSLAAMAALDRWLPVARFDVAAGWSLVAAVPALLLIGWAALLFRRAGTPIEPYRDATALVAAGPYRWSRNPIYLGLVLLLVGFWLHLASLTPAVVPPAFAVVLGRAVIAREEAALTARFGDGYRAYARRVRRWL